MHRSCLLTVILQPGSPWRHGADGAGLTANRNKVKVSRSQPGHLHIVPAAGRHGSTAPGNARDQRDARDTIEEKVMALKGELFASAVDEVNVFGGRLDDDIRGLLA